MRHNTNNTAIRKLPRRRARMGFESLEGRQLMATDLSAAPILSLPAYVATVSDPVVVGGSAADASATGLEYVWDFGDGSPTVSGIDLKTPSHVYKTSGTFNLSLSVVDPNGNGSITGTTASPAATAVVTVGMAPIPELARWKSQMLTFGRNAANLIAPIATGASVDPLLGYTYYDAQRVFLQIGDYTGDASWLVAADNAEKIYRDGFVSANNGQVPGYWIFAKGMQMDYLRTGDTASRDALLALSTNAAYASDATDPTWTAPAFASREVAYNIMTQLAVEEIGGAPRARTNLLVDQALGHIDQWFVSKTAPYIQPFMVGLTCDALIQWYEKTGDPRVPGAIKSALDGMWERTWNAESRAFAYVDKAVEGVGEPTPAADLNLLIAPAYAWLYHQTGDVVQRDRGDQVFAGGVTKAWLFGPKQFDQNYKWSFDFVNWRTADPLTASAAATNSGPRLLAGGAQTASEGASTKFFLGSVTDTHPGSSAPSVEVDWGDGTADTVIAVASNGVLPEAAHLYADDGVYTVTQTLHAADGSTEVRSFPVTVRNAAPTASLAQGPFSTIAGLAVAMSGSATDPSPADMAAGLTYVWNFGDGSAPVSGVNLRTPSYVYTQTGTFTVTLSVTDKDGATSQVSTATVTVTTAAVPELALWESRMLSLGARFATNLATGLAVSPTSAFTLTDLDAIKVFQQIRDYTKDASWGAAVQNAKSAYRDRYVVQNSGGVGMNWAFSNGLAQDFQKNGDAKSRDAVLMLSQKAAYVSTATPTAWLADASTRAVTTAQGIQTFMDLEDLGFGRNSRIDSLVTVALGHLNQWFVTRTAASGDLAAIGQTFQALIRYQEKTGDARVLPALRNALDWMWSNSWDVNAQAFRSINKATATGFNAASALGNMTIAPAFAWVYLKTGDTAYRDRGDQAFASGVRNGAVNGNRDFDLAYSWSFNYVQWRKAANG